MAAEAPEQHPFVRHPHRTLIGLSLPVLVSLVAEPLTGVVDTAFVARLGAVELASLGMAATVISSVFWVFNFLGIGTQTEVARGLGARQSRSARDACGLAVAMGFGIGVLICGLGWPLAEAAATAMGATDTSREGAATYLRIRLLGGPAVLMTISAFGALRGLQDMRTPLWIAVSTNSLNVVLDALLIFGPGPFPRLELAGAAWASTVSHWIGAGLALGVVTRRLGLPSQLAWHDAARLLVVGRDLFLRTGALLLFIALATRVANRIGVESGAAHQAIRQIWMLTALLLDAWAIAAQSLIGYFVAAARVELARRVAAIGCAWAGATGLALCGLMWIATDGVARALVPESARAAFAVPWLLSALAQPFNALSFVTDGVHWGTRDYRYLRNAMFIATLLAGGLLLLVDGTAVTTLGFVWIVTNGWITVRAVFGVLRIWPGIGRAPLYSESTLE